MAGGGPVSEVQASRSPRAADAALVAVPGMRIRHLGHGRDRLASNQGPVDAVVLGGLSGRDPDAGFLGPPAPAAVGDPPVRDGLGDAAEAPPGQGAARSLTGFVRANVAHGAVVLTDAWGGYAPLSEMGYRHRSRTQGDPRRASKILPRIHRVFGNLKTWLRGTHHGVGHTHLQAYLDEFTFRFNRRRVPMAAFQTLLGLGSLQQPTTYKQLYVWSQP